jgi:hypothetical protein
MVRIMTGSEPQNGLSNISWLLDASISPLPASTVRRAEIPGSSQHWHSMPISTSDQVFSIPHSQTVLGAAIQQVTSKEIEKEEEEEEERRKMSICSYT